MKDNFDLRKFLTENKLTSTSKALREEEIPFRKIYKADFNEIKEYLLKKLSSQHDGHVVDGVLQELFESAENLVDEQPGTSELDAVYSVAENLEDIYYENEKDEEYKIANEISKILERIYNESKDVDEDQERDHQFYANQEGAKVIMQIAKDAINLMDEQPGTSPHTALESVLEQYIEDNDLE